MTAATVRVNTGGISHARVISQADTAVSASALPSDSAPSATASAIREILGRISDHASRSGSRRDTDTPHVHNGVADRQHPVAVTDDKYGVPAVGAPGDGVEDPRLGGPVEMGGGLVEQQE